MTASEQCRELIRRVEGLRLKAYLCPAGIPSIGYGHTAGVKLGQRCTKEQAEAWLVEDLAVAEARLAAAALTDLAQHQFDAVVSFAYNTFEMAFRRSTLVSLARRGEHARAAEQFGRWVWARDPEAGKMLQLPGLIKRRAAEAALYRGEADYLQHL